MAGKGKIKAFRVVLALVMLFSVGLPGAAVSAAAPDMLGEWSITAHSSRGSINITTQSGSEFSGTVSIDAGNTEKLINGRISGNTVTFTRAWDSGSLRQDYTGTLTVSGSSASMSGTFSQNGAGSYTWSATKTTPMSSPATPEPTPGTAPGGLIPISGAVLNDQLSFKLDGKSVVPVGDDGTPVLPISYSGTTYLPVRAVGYLLGLGIDWDGATKTVLITSTTTKTAPAASAAAKTGKLIPISGAVLNGELKFKLDGKAAVPVGDNGTPVLPISYNGTTYLPVRAMGYLLGLGIDWDGATKTVLITRSQSGPGWYFTKWEYVVSSADGTKTGSFANGDIYTETSETAGEKNNFTVTVTRVDKNGKTIASGSATTVWTDPPAYFGANDLPVITVARTVGSSWGISQFSVTFDSSTINPGYGTAGKINFATPAGETYIQAYSGTMQAQKMIAGSPGAEKAVILHLNGYGFKYYYEWRE
ncbi:copper amine oxidase N-terminal domain-containing protein [Papillibacter cinnamivorans]|uniref:Copper amine oxidase N-terminal domain-containing protein n=1 Tax=Papillibacter cinnamivorans DSM 12816 TaxID=1122930 RepID=A0A1W1ZH27_9FIRM|nr:copper amine oxidase N-terminal domain-containing protein [Papillibacter cinnamivorans]SMC47338.1 Copper amine oxidase N-terminal domain-containing protein [Papillibacter cinnamivorans DSM 12816]